LNGAQGVVALKSGKTLRTKGFQVIPDGDRLILELPGGGGMGPPAERDPVLLGCDVRDGLVSAERARALYGAAPAAD
jgi:N-methylhydantoinase B